MKLLGKVCVRWGLGWGAGGDGWQGLKVEVYVRVL